MAIPGWSREWERRKKVWISFPTPHSWRHHSSAQSRMAFRDLVDLLGQQCLDDANWSYSVQTQASISLVLQRKKL